MNSNNARSNSNVNYGARGGFPSPVKIALSTRDARRKIGRGVFPVRKAHEQKGIGVALVAGFIAVKSSDEDKAEIARKLV